MMVIIPSGQVHLSGDHHDRMMDIVHYPILLGVCSRVDGAGVSGHLMTVVHPSTAYFDESRLDSSANFPVVAGFWNPLDVWDSAGAIRRAVLARSADLEPY